MRRIAFLLVIVGLSMMFPDAGAQHKMTQIGSISGTALKAIRATLPFVKEKGIKLDKYEVSVFEGESDYFVAFRDPNRPEGIRGSSPHVLEFNMKVSKDKFEVINVCFIK